MILFEENFVLSHIFLDLNIYFCFKERIY